MHLSLHKSKIFLCLHVRNFDFDISYFCMFQCINFHNVTYAEMDDRAYRERVKRQGLFRGVASGAGGNES